MLYFGRIIKKPKYEIGDTVRVKDLGVRYTGRIGHMDYRFDGHVGWHYKITFPWAQLTFAEKSIKKISVRKKK
jgi:hypothetical protein